MMVTHVLPRRLLLCLLHSRIPHSLTQIFLDNFKALIVIVPLYIMNGYLFAHFLNVSFALFFFCSAFPQKHLEVYYPGNRSDGCYRIFSCHVVASSFRGHWEIISCPVSTSALRHAVTRRFGLI